MWTKIKFPAKEEKVPEGYATLGRGFLRFGVTACGMIPNIADFPFVEFLRDNEDPDLIGVTFRTQQTEDSLPVILNRSKAVKKRLSDGVVVSGREELEYVFGPMVLNNIRARKAVTLDATQANTLIIHLNRAGNEENETPIVDDKAGSKNG